MLRDNETWLAHLSSRGADQQAALSDLRDRLLRGLRRSLPTWTVDDAFLEDAVQDSLVRILDRIAQFEGRSRFLTWATAIAIRVAMSELRRRRWKDVSLDDVIEVVDSAPERSVGGESAPDVQWEKKAIIEKMHHLIQNELTEKQRKALLAELKGMPQEEIARWIGSNRNAVYKLTHDARRRLKAGLEAAGYRADHIQTAFAN